MSLTALATLIHVGVVVHIDSNVQGNITAIFI